MKRKAINETMRLATHEYKIGNIARARKLFSKVINIEPKHADANNNMGVLLCKSGCFEQSLAFFNAALKSNSGNMTHWRNYLEALFELKRITETSELLRAARRNGCEGQFFDNLEATLGSPTYQREIIFERLLKLLAQGEAERVLKVSQKLLKENPNSLSILNIMISANERLGNFENLIENYNQVLQLKPDYPEAYNNLGNVFRDLRQNDDAIVAFNRALSLKPDYADAYINLGNSLKDLFKFSAAIKSYRKAIDLQPDLAAVYSNMGLALKEQGKSEKAIQAYKKAITIDPDYVDAYYNLSFALLGCRDFKQGFELQEWRWKTSQRRGQFLQSSKPIWGGEKNKTVYVWGEQGIGDEIMFASMLPELYEECANLIVKCDSRLIPIFQRSFPSKIEYYGRDAAVLEDSYDFHIPMGSLCSKYRTSLESFKNASAGFLKNDVERTKTLKNKIQAGSTKKVIGISWKTRSPLLGSITRNIELVDLVQTLDSPNTQLVCLQYGDVDDELEALRKDFGIDIMQVSEVDNLQNIDGLASLIMACDEVVSTTNATVHLAGALGANVKVLLPYSSRWIWGEGSDSFWYETAVPYAQNTWGSWENVLRAIAEK